MLVDENTGFVVGLVTSNVKHLPFHLLQQQASSHAPVTVNSPQSPSPSGSRSTELHEASRILASPVSSRPASPVIIPRLNFTIPCLEPLAPLLQLTSQLTAGNVSEAEYISE